mmetsp:Transcript_11693/g.17737  ORF Transcript_11693/g.17737 Transcript_11693/m.17737 type:complete len:92 (+) Transcript_11693:17-292(+)
MDNATNEPTKKPLGDPSTSFKPNLNVNSSFFQPSGNPVVQFSPLKEQKEQEKRATFNLGAPIFSPDPTSMPSNIPTQPSILDILAQHLNAP